MYRIIATAPNGTDATQPEVIGEFATAIYDDEDEAQDARDEAQDLANEHHDGVTVTVVELDAPSIEAPEGVMVDVRAADGVLTVSYWFEGDEEDEALYKQVSDEFAAAAMRVGLAFTGHAGGEGGPCIFGGTRYAGGFYEQYRMAH